MKEESAFSFPILPIAYAARMAKSDTSRRTANDLPSELMRQHRVMFVRGNSDGSMTVVTDQMRAGLDATLSKTLRFPVKVIGLIEAPDDAAQAFPMIMGAVNETKAAVRDTLTPRSGDSKTSRSRRKQPEPKPE